MYEQENERQKRQYVLSNEQNEQDKSSIYNNQCFGYFQD